MGEAGHRHAAETTALVLVVEDEFLIAMELADLLEDAGYAVLGPASNVRAALGLLDGQTPDAAVLDVNLGSERVTPVAQHLRERRIPYLVVTAYVSSDLANEPLLAGAVRLDKPVAAPSLLRALSTLLAR